MQRLARSEARHAALTAVHRDTVRYHNGCAGPALGFTWSEGVGGQMFEDMRHALRELWAADLVDVDTHRLFAHREHRVTTTTPGYLLWRAWQDQGTAGDPNTDASPTHRAPSTVALPQTRPGEDVSASDHLQHAA